MAKPPQKFSLQSLAKALRNLNLAQKGLLFIAIPMVLQLAFTIFMARIVDRSQTVAQFEYRSKAVIGNINWLMVALSFAGKYALEYRISHKQEAKNFAYFWLGRLDLASKDLKALPQKDRVSLQIEEDFAKSVGKIRNLIVSVLDTPIDEKLDLASSELISDATQKLWENMLILRSKLLLQERKDLSVNMQDLPAVRNQLTLVTQGAVLLTLGLTFYLVYIFNVQIAKRLGLLSDNTVRLSKGMPLNEPQLGTDEIANLDAFFRKMADELTASKLELELSEERLRNLIENLPIGLLTLNEQLNIQSINARASEMFLTPAKEAVSVGVKSLIPSIPQTFMNEAREMQPSAEDQSTHLDVETVNAVGKRMFLELTLKANQFRDENVRLLTINDITERKNMEQLREDFLNMVTHDLRSPLASIGLTHQLLLRSAYGELSEKAKDKLEKAERNVERLIRLINDLLDFEKMRAGSIELSTREMNSDALVALSVESVAALSEQKQIKIVLPKDNCRFVADEGRLVQVLTNLLGNAIKFSESGQEIKIEVREKNRVVEFRVVDFGRGIPKEKREAIFEKYKQVRTEDYTEKGGTGLGLPICKLIVEMHGGTIGVESEVGKGSTFFFKIPRDGNVLDVSGGSGTGE
jgi:PAS domain S-box-containing protein